MKKNKSFQELEQLRKNAIAGDDTSEAEYRKEVRRIAKSANQQLLQLERKGYKNISAYKNVQSFLKNKNRFSESNKTMSISDLEKQVKSIIEFKSSKESSIKYLNRVSMNSDALRPALHEALKQSNKRVTKKLSIQMNELFMSDAWKETKASYGRGSTNLVLAAADAFRSGKTIDDLEKSYKRYSELRDDNNGKLEMDIVEMWENFADYY